MIQRIQTIYLVLASLLLGLTFAFPFATYALSQGDVIFNAYGVTDNAEEINTFFPYYITIALSMGLALFSILQYKKRKLQITVGRFVYLLLTVTIAFIFIDFWMFPGFSCGFLWICWLSQICWFSLIFNDVWTMRVFDVLSSISYSLAFIFWFLYTLLEYWFKRKFM